MPAGKGVTASGVGGNAAPARLSGQRERAHLFRLQPAIKPRLSSLMTSLHDETSSDESSDRNHITALARGLTVLRGFAGQRDQLTLAERARIVDLPRATVRRCLLTLSTLG